MKISLGTWAFSFGPYADHPIPFDRVAERAAAAGYDGLEVCGFPPHVTLDRYPDAASRRELARRLGGLNLGLSGYSPDLSLVNPCAAGNRDRYLDLFRRNLELCVDLGIPAIRLDSGTAPGSLDDAGYTAAFDRLAAVWHEAAALAHPAGVRAVWEFEPGFAFNKPSEVLALHEKVAHPGFSVLFDTSHAYLCGVVGARQQGKPETLSGGVAELLRRLAGRIGAIHLIDTDGTLYGDETSRHCTMGEGKIDFRKLVPGLLGLAGIEWWCIDLCFHPGAWELVERELAFVRKLLPA